MNNRGLSITGNYGTCVTQSVDIIDDRTPEEIMSVDQIINKHTSIITKLKRNLFIQIINFLHKLKCKSNFFLLGNELHAYDFKFKYGKEISLIELLKVKYNSSINRLMMKFKKHINY